ncbi:MAG: sigma-70 family RNA polymerase sigma factor [Bacteroidota bacterium]
MEKEEPRQLAEHFFRHSYAKLVAILVRYFGLPSVNLAEDIVQDTLVTAMEAWSLHGLPERPEAWLMDVAKKKTINVLKRDRLLAQKILPRLREDWRATETPLDDVTTQDSTLRMIFACCHPSLPAGSRIALALKTLCGLSIPEIAWALLTTEANVNKRLYRAKQKFRSGAVAFGLPDHRQLAARLGSVHKVVYLLFNEGYHATSHPKAIRMDLCYEAIRLQRQVLAAYPGTAASLALLALMLLQVARFTSRLDNQGGLVLLMDQDRTAWDRSLIAEGVALLQQAARGQELTTYHLQAGIAAEHCLAPNWDSTDWAGIYRQYNLLIRLEDSPILRLNQSIARFYAGGREAALVALLALEETSLSKNPHYHATLGVFRAALGDQTRAAARFRKAARLTKSAPEKALLLARVAAL